jgi:peptidylprolyl isomerase
MIHTASLVLLVLGLVMPVAGQTPPSAPVVRDYSAPSDVATAPADAIKSPTGLASKMLNPGSGTGKPKATDIVTVDYTGWTTDGKMFDSSIARGRAATFPLNRVIAGWSECVQLMTVGEKRRCWVPEALGYRGQTGRPSGMLVFDIELLDAQPSPLIPPPDVAKPPGDAKRTASGIAYRTIRPGTGSRKPSQYGRVTVHYTGWTTDGKMFDSSLLRGAPTTFGLDDVIRGWSEGVQLMVEGERTRFWIPENLAYKGQPGSPRGMLVFDIELVRIEQ